MPETRDIGNLIQDLTWLGLESTGLRITVVRAGSLEAETNKNVNSSLMAVTGGAVNQDILSLTDYHRIPSCPFQPGLKWKSFVVVCARSPRKA